MRDEPNGPYVYQPHGMRDKEFWDVGRIYAVSGVSDVTIIDGLTRSPSPDLTAATKPMRNKLAQKIAFKIFRHFDDVAWAELTEDEKTGLLNLADDIVVLILDE